MAQRPNAPLNSEAGPTHSVGPVVSSGQNVDAVQPVGGLTPFSTVDWPDQIVATVFLKGCPWRCVYCHNKDFFTTTPAPSDLTWGEVTSQLESRPGLLDGVVFTGGEPTSTAVLEAMMREVRAMGFAVGLHTNGVNPTRLAELLAATDEAGVSLIDWVGLDIKAPFARYGEITQREGSGEAAQESLRIIRDSGIDHELRTTLYPSVFNEETLVALGQELADAGESETLWALQRCREEDLIHEIPLSFSLEQTVEQQLRPLMPNIIVR